MALRDFFGTWQIQLTHGTPFGPATAVRIEPATDARADSGEARITFESLPDSIRASYDPSSEMLRAEDLPIPGKALFLSRFSHPGEAYRAIYGILIHPESDPAVSVWSAEIRSASDPEASTPVPDPPPLSSFTGTFGIRAAAGSEFASRSRVKIADGANRLTVSSPSDIPELTLDSLDYDLATVSLEGKSTAAEKIYQWSLAPYAGRRFVFGLSIGYSDTKQDWPEQAGACGAEEEP